MQLVLTPEIVLQAYRQGLFPMAYSADSPYVHWVCPEHRGQLSIPEMHIPRRLKKTVRSELYKVVINQDFDAVIRLCAEAKDDRPETWINSSIIKVYNELHKRGFAHSVECHDPETGALVGGLYGLAIGGAFFGESMVSRARDASKVALVHLVARLQAGGFTLLDIQFINDHLLQFGAYEVPHRRYLGQLESALGKKGDFILDGKTETGLLDAYWASRSPDTGGAPPG